MTATMIAVASANLIGLEPIILKINDLRTHVNYTK